MTNRSINRLALGTAQFGLGYGLASNYQQVDRLEVEEILIRANIAGLDVLDTATSYGQSEKVLGDSNLISPFKIITKTLPIRKNNLTQEHLCKIQISFTQSLINLKSKSLDGLLVHDANDLLVEGSDELWAWMQYIKSRGLVQRIGASVYDCETLRQLAQRYELDFIQIPYNVLDQRLDAENIFDFCSQKKIVVHVRSIFLQGVILMNPIKLPCHLVALEGNLCRLSEAAKDLSVPIQTLALAFVTRRPEIEQIIVGVHNRSQLNDLLSAWTKLEHVTADSINWAQFDCKNVSLVDPRRWS
jgi:aryl-alcohol dehydrogenase-like predicted oxidoreductase